MSDVYILRVVRGRAKGEYLTQVMFNGKEVEDISILPESIRTAFEGYKSIDKIAMDDLANSPFEHILLRNGKLK